MLCDRDHDLVICLLFDEALRRLKKILRFFSLPSFIRRFGPNYQQEAGSSGRVFVCLGERGGSDKHLSIQVKRAKKGGER